MTHPDALSPGELIGLMLMVGVRGHAPEDPRHRQDLAACRSARVGGVILFDVHLPDYFTRRTAGESDLSARSGAARNIISPSQTWELSDRIRRELGPLALISVDQEGGRVARLSPGRGFEPTLSQLELSATPPPARAQHAARLASMVRAAGCDLNFSPCVDAAVNPDSPVIAGKHRSFGSDADHIVTCAAEVISAHAAAGVVTCLKHFPGHGSAQGDTHAGFVDVTHTFRADPELTVYHQLLPRTDPRLTAIMPAHVFHAGIDPDHPASLSRAHISGLLRQTLGFRGVVITDSLDMGAVTRRYGPDEAVLLAVNAGADILLDGFNAPPEPGVPEPECPAPRMHESISRALRDGRVVGGEARLRESAARILRLQRWSRPSMMGA